ncbi:hypothetical protein F4775DRAFT_593304 [Biscogniauxia sp. FL1348]|nr:hypothetical protein F4775DRAFT_593304 [Biscogniauxia sp. FL1348]
MVQTRKERKAAAGIKLAQPDRSGPTEATLLQFAQERKLFEKADKKQKKNRRSNDRGQGDDADGDDDDDDDDDDRAALSPRAERIMEALLWTVSLAMLHFTLDVLVQHQYAIDISWPQIVRRSIQALFVFFLLFYVLHPHASSPILLPGLPVRFQAPLRQAIFFVASIASGCYLIHISNVYGYLAVMKQSPPLGCLWVWSIIELDLPLAVVSLAFAGGFFYQGGYTIR